MRHPLHLLRLTPLVFLAACATRAGESGRIAKDIAALPPNTVMLSRMMSELSAQPGFTESLLAQINKNPTSGASFTPQLFDLFRKLILGKDWQGLDRFPGWTIERVTKTINAAEPLLKKQQGTDLDANALKVTLGTYALDQPASVSLDKPSTEPAFQLDQKPLGNDVTSGDGPNPKLAPLHSESVRLAQVLNRLSLNGFTPNGRPTANFVAEINGEQAETPQQLIAALQQSGHTVTVADARYFANFGHFHYKGQDVQMPFFLDTGLKVPREHWWRARRKLITPVAHAEYEWIISGPRINADVTFYFGIDGRAEFRTNDTLNQTWTMGRHAHEYRNADAVEVTRLTGSLLRAYAYLHLAHPAMPFGGYYTLGVCQDVVAAIEQHMTGTTTIYPNTAQTKYFHDQPDEEVFQLMSAIPKDTEGKPPAPERVFGSLPATDYATITIPGLREDLERTNQAFRSGKLDGLHGLGQPISWVGLALGTILVLLLMRSRRRKS